MRKDLQSKSLLHSLMLASLAAQHGQSDAQENSYGHRRRDQQSQAAAKPGEKLTVTESRQYGTVLPESDFPPDILIEVSWGTREFLCFVAAQKIVQFERVHILKKRNRGFDPLRFFILSRMGLAWLKFTRPKTEPARLDIEPVCCSA